MFAKKVLISLALVAAIPSALSRHVRTWEDRLFPDDLVQKFPPTNIEDLHFSQDDVIPVVETQPDFGEDDNTQGQKQEESEVVPNDDDIIVDRVHSVDVHPEIEQIPDSENNANDQNDYPNQDEVIVPEEKLNVRQREPVVIMAPSDNQSQDYPEYNEQTENKNEEVQTWDDDDSNDIPQTNAPSRKGWFSY